MTRKAIVQVLILMVSIIHSLLLHHQLQLISVSSKLRKRTYTRKRNEFDFLTSPNIEITMFDAEVRSDIGYGEYGLNRIEIIEA